METGFGNEEDLQTAWGAVCPTNAVLCHLRDGFRSGDIWLAHSRRYGDLKDALVPADVARATPRLAMPFEPEIWLADRKSRLTDGLQRLARAAKAGAIPGGSIEDGILKIDRLTAAVPVHSPHQGFAIQAPLPLRSSILPERTERLDRRQDQGTRFHLELA
tara:strand:- start:69 stop:551 length:483 start_codon:yes stop_codon:yes gene_type:complete